MTKQTVAVIGGGIAGLASAWLLRERHQVQLIEGNAYVGGHTHTVDVPGDRGTVGVDTGFVVLNPRNYPNLCALFRHLDVATQASDMSFAVSAERGRLEYSGSSLDGLFAQRRNLASPRFLGMLRDILRFNRAARALVLGGEDPGLSLGAFLDREGLGETFRRHYLLPMGAAIWSCPMGEMLAFPALSFCRFYHNHGLLDLRNRPQWRTVVGGSRSYVERMLEDLPDRAVTGDPAVSVRRRPDGVEVTLASGHRLRADQAVLACHADQALALMDNPTAREREVLGAFRYQGNRAVLHTDADLMPRSRRVWSSWNHITAPETGLGADVSVTYWMNRLQRLPCRNQYFVSLNPLTPPRPERVLAEMRYDHPVFDAAAMAAQGALGEIQGRHRLWFAGAYHGYGFHEDGLRSALAVAAGLGARAPWQAATPGPAPEPAPAEAVVLP